jgi:putative oxidoreductase
MKYHSTISLILRGIIAVIFLQTLYFKFTAHPDSVHIFSALGAEPVGRIALGIIELITASLLIIPATKYWGILVSMGIILGAIGSHILVLGFQIKGDGGGLFILALIVFFASLLLFYIHRDEFSAWFHRSIRRTA